MANIPKRVLNAFVPVGRDGGGIALREMSAGIIMLLKQIDSPLMQTVKKGQKPKAIGDMDLMRAIFVFARPGRQVFELLALGPKHLDAAVMEFADSIPVTDLPALGARINDLLERATSTVTASEKKTATDAVSCPTLPAAAAAGC